MIKLCISGALGKMGQTVAKLSFADKEFQVASALEHPNHKDLNKEYGTLLQLGRLEVFVTSDRETSIKHSDIVIDFSTPENTMELLKVCEKYQKPIVIGTTGFTDMQLKEIQSFSVRFPILQSPNMSLGVNILFYLVEKASIMLKDFFEVEISEIHHSKKKDSPSGTALQLKKIIQAIYNISETDIVYGREGFIGERPKQQLGIHAIRGGDVVGEHTVYFFSSGERIEISHKATSREIFAKGALIAAKWLQNQAAGFYTMKDVIGIGNVLE